MNLRQDRRRMTSVRRADWATHRAIPFLAIPLLALGGCQDMKNAMQGGFAQASAAANQEADRQAAYARGEDPDAVDRPSANNAAYGPSSSTDGSSNHANGNTTATGAGSSGTASPGTSSEANGASHAVAHEAGSASDQSEGAGVTENGYDADPGAAAHGGAKPAGLAEPTITNRKEDVEIGTERWGWTDAKVGWYVRYKVQGGMEMSQEVVDVTEDLLLMETKSIMPGMDLPATRAWQARLMVKYEGDATTDCDSETKDLADESLSVNGQSVICKVAEATTTCPGVTTHSKSWMSDEVPGELVKSVVDGQVAMELIEYRK